MTQILHLGKYYPPDVGGIESVTFSLSKGAVSQGYKVNVVCFNKNADPDLNLLDGVHIHRMPIAKTIASQPLGLKYIRLCLRESQHADIIHVHIPNMLAALCCLFANKKALLLVHWHSDIIKKGWLGSLSRPIEKMLLKSADCVVASTQNYADSSPLLQSVKHKVVVIPYGVPDAKHAASTASEKTELPPDLAAKLKGKRIILAVGRLVPYKGFHVLVEAAQHLSDDDMVVIVGDGPLKASLQATIAQTGVGHRVQLAGKLSDAVLQTLFSQATLFCLPSVERSEAFGVVLLEAMACHLPIVTTEIAGSGVPWVNQHQVSGLNVSVGNAVALAQACNLILNSKDEHSRLAQGARQRYLQEFTEEVFVQRMTTTYRQLLAGSLGSLPG